MTENRSLRRIIGHRELGTLSHLLESAVLQLHQSGQFGNRPSTETAPLGRHVLRHVTKRARPSADDVLVCLAAESAGIWSLLGPCADSASSDPSPSGFSSIRSQRFGDCMALLAEGDLAPGRLIPGPPLVVDHLDGTLSPADQTLVLHSPTPDTSPGACIYWRVPGTPADAALLPQRLPRPYSESVRKLFEAAPWDGLPAPWRKPVRTLALLERPGSVAGSPWIPGRPTAESVAFAVPLLRAHGGGPVFDRIPSSALPIVAAFADRSAARWLLRAALDVVLHDPMMHALTTEDRLRGGLLALGWWASTESGWTRAFEYPGGLSAATACEATTRLAHVLYLCRRGGPFGLRASWDALLEASHLLRPDLLNEPFLPGSGSAKGYPIFREALAATGVSIEGALPLSDLPRSHRDVLALRGIGENRLGQLTRALHHSLQRALVRNPIAATPLPSRESVERVLDEGLSGLQQLFESTE